MVFTMFYVSQSLLHGPDAVAQVQDIIDRSTRWNASMGVTGALAFTERHFAQCIEGGEDIIRALMVRIENDPRHANVTIRRARPERVRRFERWSMAYWGPEIFLEPHILPLIEPLPESAVDAHVTDLIDLMHGFASQV